MTCAIAGTAVRATRFGAGKRWYPADSFK